jgi:hypothetical protein
MNPPTCTSQSLERGRKAIASLDLDPIKFKLTRQDGEGWTAEQVNAVEKWYRRFLFLNLKYQETASIVPTKTIDAFWHYHILDTIKYAEDCQEIFGYFLHHFPYFGMRGEEDEKNLKQAFDETAELFFAEFGESLSELRNVFDGRQVRAGCEGTECGGTACGSTNCDGGDKCKSSVFEIRPTFDLSVK